MSWRNWGIRVGEARALLLRSCLGGYFVRARLRSGGCCVSLFVVGDMESVDLSVV